MYNNNQYNPYYGAYMPQYGANTQSQYNLPTQQQTMPQMANYSQNKGLQGKVVESVDIVKTIEVPFDGSITYFPLADGSGIITKQLQNNGTSKITIYKRLEEENKKDSPITLEELKTSLDELKTRNNDDILNALEEIKKELKKKSDK